MDIKGTLKDMGDVFAYAFQDLAQACSKTTKDTVQKVDGWVKEESKVDSEEE